jgi:hypothetical protein
VSFWALTGRIPVGLALIGCNAVGSDAGRVVSCRPAQPALPPPADGTALTHTVLDDHSRLAYSEIRDNEEGNRGLGAPHRGRLVRPREVRITYAVTGP